ncbi:MAG: methyltransferase domain-containing protein [Nodularia sp. (in: Bacteria)]|nr:MAG: methyltransferase domain-containing protein [Nodularia sp. (in: cyanobacteria)]
MPEKKYVSNAFLKCENSALYAIFAWSKKSAEIIPTKSWLIALEIFVHEHSLAKAYQIFQEIKLAAIPKNIIDELGKYENLNEDAIVFIADSSVTIFGKGFRSFIEKEMQFELGGLSQETYKVLLQLFCQCQLKDDLADIQNIEDFTQLVESLENIGLLSPPKGTLEWGDLKKQFPICQAFGLTRGTPIDRYYINKFIQENRSQVVGNILEVGGTPKDKDFYQIDSSKSYKILNIEPGSSVDIVGDVHEVSIIEPESFDSIIIVNVLEHCYAPWIAVENIYTWLKPGGKCIATVPSAIRVHTTPGDYWRFLADGVSWMFKNFSQQQLYVYGNPTSVIASYHGIAAEELTAEELDNFHPDYPVAICIVAEK